MLASTSSAPPPAPAPAGTADECDICCERYNRSNHARVTCCYCHSTTCRSCCQKYILDQSEASCVHCKNIWNREFIDANFTRTFREGEFKRKREEVLLGIEEALLPATQHQAAAERDRASLAERRVQLTARMRALRAQADALRTEIWRVDDQMYRLRNIAHLDGDAAAAGGAEGERRQFIKHCPADGCKGFLTTQYNCGLCHLKVCSKCLAPKGDDPDAHTCDPDTLASVELLMRDTRPCPGCATPIHKIDGCDQMWCTQCKTAFSWRTGRVERGHVHNPHWYEWQRRMNNGQIPREPGDQPGGCGGGGGGGGGRNNNNLPRVNELTTGMRDNLRLMRIHRQLQHISHVVLPEYRGQFRLQNNRDLRIRFLLGQITREAWMKTLQQREKKVEKEQALRQALEVLIHGSADILYRMLAEPRRYRWDEAEPELEGLRAYTNECLFDVCSRFKCTFRLIIAPNWEVLK
jgi:hypothetical protein